MDLQGSIPPMVTPIAEDTGEVNTEVLRTYTRYLIDGGVNSLFPCGSTGEFPSLTRGQRKQVVETVADVADDMPVLAGCGDTSLDRIDRLIEDAASAGADAAVIVTPYYLEVTQASLRDFFTTVADQSPIPVILYEIPPLTGQQFSVDTVAALAEHDNIVGLKASIEDILHLYDLVQNTPQSFNILTGLPELTIQSLDVGGSGVIAGPANVFPSTVAQIIEFYHEQAYRQAVELLNEVIMPVLSTIRSMPTVPALKYLLTLRDFDVGPPLQPMPRLDDAQRRSLESLFAELRDSPTSRVDA